MKDKAHLYHIYCKVKNWIHREKYIIQSNQDVHMYEVWWMKWRLLVYDLFLSINSFEDMAISLFFLWTFMCPFFLIFFTWTFMCPHIFFYSTCLFFLTITGERPRHIVEHLVFGMDEWYNANLSYKPSKGYMVCTSILIMIA